jgi:phosphoglycolate phosphatase
MINRGLVIFDLDGTLFHSAIVTVAAVQRSFEEMGLRQPDKREILSYIGRPANEFHDWLRRQCSTEGASQLVASVDRYELDLIGQKGELYPGVLQALTQIRAFVDQMAICTNGPETYVQRIVTTQGLHRFFDGIRCWQSHGDTKGLMVRELLGQLHGRPAIVVGDRGHDIEAAHQNGLAAVAVKYGYGSTDELQNADAAAEAISDLPRLIQALLLRT